MEAPRLEVRGASKTFGSTRVLADVDLVVQPGEIHALIGQNGSGKSTLVKLLTGYHVPDPGMSLSLDGQPLGLPARWEQARAAGMSVVHQDLGLLDQMTVAENIGVGGYHRTRVLRRVSWASEARRTAALLARLDVPVRPDARVGDLSAVRRAEVAIARGLRDHEPGRGLVILDEATRALPREELLRFHDLLRRVVADGTAVLMVSHNLDEVLTLAERVTILRDGRVTAAAASTSELTEQQAARLMLGRCVTSLARRDPTARPAQPAVTVEDLTADEVGTVSFTVARGEVVGLTGLPGSGFEAIPYLLGGARRARAGRLRTASGVVDLARSSVSLCLRAGIALVPERRDRDGLALEMSIRDNVAVPRLSEQGRPWWVSRRWQERDAAIALDRFGIVARSGATLVKELSGGNQQKVLLAKWMSVGPELLVLHEPTQAVDVGARQDLLRAIHDAADGGLGVLLVSNEPADLVEACDRVLVHSCGRPLQELRPSSADQVLDAVYATATRAACAAGGSP
jgi:ribose transport system ATP-binding protein